MKNSVKVAVTGAAGQIGYALLFRIASGQMFGPDTFVELSLCELEQAIGSLKGVVMELEDCAFPLLRKVSISSDPVEAFKDVDWALLVGAVPRRKGMERGDLLKINAKVFIEQGQALDKSAKSNCRVLVVGNPCNTNAFIVKECAKSLKPQNIFAMTMLDQHRAVAQVAAKARVPVTEVSPIVIWGNHSATQFPDFFHAKIQGQDVINSLDQAWLKTTFIENVQKRGAAIIEARGLSSAASAANGIVDTVKAVIGPTPEGQAFSLGVVSDGSYGIPEGIIFSYPVKSTGLGLEIIQGIEHGVFAQTKLQMTLEELVAEREAVLESIENV